MKLFVDDTREFPKAGYQCCRTAADAKMLLRLMKFDVISLDYNLGKNQETGLDILVWMKENGAFVPEIIIHSNNVRRIEEMVEYTRHNFPESQVTINTRSK